MTNVCAPDDLPDGFGRRFRGLATSAASGRNLNKISRNRIAKPPQVDYSSGDTESDSDSEVLYSLSFIGNDLQLSVNNFLSVSLDDSTDFTSELVVILSVSC